MTEDAITNQPRGATPIEDISGLIPDITTRGELNEAESLNILNAIDWVQSGRIEDPMTVSFYRVLHHRMYEEVWTWAGKLRTETGDAVKPPFNRQRQPAPGHRHPQNSLINAVPKES